jgi:hypothetical protein
MSIAELTLFWADEEIGEGDLGLLTAEVKAGGYAGHGSAWFRPDFLRETLVAELRRRPVWPIALDQGTLQIRMAPFHGADAVLVETRLSAPAQSPLHPMTGLENELTVRFIANYEAILRFAAAIEAQLDGGDIPSILTGS